jgi:hypothetical protein
MSVKFRLSFTVEAETMFGLMAKLMPIEDLSVEELREREPRALPKIAARIAAPKPKPQPKRPHREIKLDKGMNACAMRVFADGEPHQFKEVAEALKEAGFSGNGVGNLLNRLARYDLVVSLGQGAYRKR